jgi:hypothetical protein
VDLLLTGTARAAKIPNPPAELTANNLVPVNVVIEAKLVDALTASVVWTDQFDSQSYDLAADKAALKASRQAAEGASSAITGTLTIWIQDHFRSVYVVVVSGFKNFAAYNTFVQKLSTVAGVNRVQPRDFNANGTEIEVEFDGDTTAFATMLEKAGLQIMQLTGREIRAKAK